MANMFKTLIIVGICCIVLIECMPASKEKFSNRIVRQTQNISPNVPNNSVALGINMATQMANTAAKAAENAIKLGEQAMQGMAQTAMTGTQFIPGFG